MNGLQNVVRTVAPWIVVVSLATIACAAGAQTPPTSGTWTLSDRSDGRVAVELSIHGATSSWEYGDDEPLNALRGLDRKRFDGSGAGVQFSIVRDAGSLRCDGRVAHGAGGGTFAYVPSPTFASELARRGMGALTPMDQFRMTMASVTLAFIDKLRRAGYAPSATQVISTIDHGVSRRYLEGLVAIGLHPDTIDELIRLRDHGVSVDYASGIEHAGYSPTIDQLIRLRDHGVSLAYVERLKRAGYRPSIGDLIRLRDAGV